MQVILSDVSQGPNGRALPLTSLEFHSGSAALVPAETERRPTVLGLIASGRMRPDTGTVRLNGEADAAGLRLRVALVDAPDVSDPAADVTVARVVAEELSFAGRLGTGRATRNVLAGLGLLEQARLPMANLPPAARIRLLVELALLRDGVEAVVITAPDRHGGDPLAWWQLAQEIAGRGYAVLVIAGAAAVAVIEAGDSGLTGSTTPVLNAAQNPASLPEGGDTP